MKTHIDRLRNPNYFGSWDLMDENGIVKNRIVTIKEIKNEGVFDQKKQEEVQVITVYFNEIKPIILNSTNRKTLKKVTETDFIEEMIGKRIEITSKKIKAFGDLQDALRIVPNVVKAGKEIVIDKEKLMAKLNECKTIEDLKIFWTSISPKEQALPEIISRKEELKNQFTSGGAV